MRKMLSFEGITKYFALSKVIACYRTLIKFIVISIDFC